MPTVKVNDIEMYYEVHGEGEPLVLLHGYFATGQDWNNFIPYFKEHFQLIIPDLRGHGRTLNPLKEFTHRQAAYDVYELLDQLGVEEFDGFGYSTGGMTLLHMATQQPSRVKSMILDSATPYFPEECREYFAKQTVEGTIEARGDFLRERHIHGEDQIRQLCQQWLGMKDNYTDMNFTQPYLSTITAKTLIAHGDRDPFFPARLALYMYDAIPNSYLWIVPNGGHALVWTEHASDVQRVALDFFTRDWVSP